MLTFARCRHAVAIAIVSAGALAGCASIDTKRQVAEETAASRKGPQQAPQQSITGFSSALRCMDNLFYTYGVRDIPVLVEDLADQTKKVNAGTKDILISAVSQMTVRSKAIRLVVYGQDSSNLIGFLRESQRRHPYAVLPEFDIKGSISQLDENVVRRQADAGVNVGSYFSAGASRSGSSSVLAVDLTMLSTSNLSVVPGVTSRNSVVIFKEGTGVDGDAQIKKFGINFNLSLARSDGQAQALRTLIELAAIELLGKLTRIPYWSCLGTAVDDAAVKSEISDWFFGMVGEKQELARYVQNQMRVRGVYRGPVDGVPNAELADAVAEYRERLGLQKNYKVNLEFFSAYLRAEHPDPVANMAPVSAVPSVPVEDVPKTLPGTPQASTPLSLTLSTANGNQPFRRGDVIGLSIVANRDAHVYCYLLDENRKILRFFPNRFNGDAVVKAGTPLVLPGTMRFRLFANDKGRDETIACFAAEHDVVTQLPAAIVGADLVPLSITSLEAVKGAFKQAARGAFAEGIYMSKFAEAARLHVCEDPTVGIEAVAAREQITRRQLERDFGHWIGTSPRHLAQIARLQAVSRHAQRGWSLARIAAEVGFADQSHMTRVVRQLTTLTPQRFVRAASTPMSAAFRAVTAGGTVYL